MEGLVAVGRVEGLCGLFDDKVVFLGILLQLVAHSAHNALNLVLEQVLQLIYVNVWLVLIEVVAALLVQRRDDVGVILAVLLRALPVVQVYQHVRQALVQSVLDSVVILLGLASLLLLLVTMGLVLLLLIVLLLLLLLLLRVLVRCIVVVLLVVVLVLGALGWVLLTLIVLLVGLGWLLVALLLVWLPLILALGCTWLTIVRLVRCLSVLSPLTMLFFNFFTDIILVAFFGPVDALLFSVLVFALFFSLFIVCFTNAHVFRCSRLGLTSSLSSRSCCLSALRLLLFVVLAFFLINEVVHSNHRLLSKHFLSILMVLTLLVLGADGLTSRRPLARLGRAWLLLHRGRLLAFHSLVLLLLLLLLRKSLRVLSSGRC